MLKNWFFSASLALTLLFKPSLVVAGVCELVDTTFTKVTTGVAGIGVVAGVGLKMAGVTVLAHSSGTAIAATASGGYLAGTLGTVGAVTGVITAPVTLIISGVAVVAAGGTIAYCNFKDNNAGARGQGSRGARS